MKEKTRNVHPPQVRPADDNPPLVAPIYQSVKFEYASVAETQRGLKGERDGFYYSRIANPTTRQLEQQLAAMQGRQAAIVLASGVAAITNTLFALLQAGDHVLCFAELYGPTRQFIRRSLKRYGVTHSILSVEDDAGIEKVLTGTPTKLIVFESPTNPMLKVADISRITGLARQYGALTLLDNTLAGLHQHSQFEVDLYLHSLTKYASGHGDVLGGAVIGDRALIDRLRSEFVLLGGTLDAHAAYLIQRGLKTYYHRYESQCQTAMQVAQYLATHPKVERVHYPGLVQHSRHALAKAQMQQFGTVVSLDLIDALAGNRFADELKLFSIAASMGSPESLIVPPALMGTPDLTADQARLTGIAPGSLRLSMGLEDVDDLLADLAQALASL